MKVRALVGGRYKDPKTQKEIRFNAGVVEMPDEIVAIYEKFPRPIVQRMEGFIPAKPGGTTERVAGAPGEVETVIKPKRSRAGGKE